MIIIIIYSLAENYEMLKAMYDFQANYPKTISFDEGEFFILHQASARQRNWWQVISMKGNIGFVPSNYVSSLKVSPIDRAILVVASTDCSYQFLCCPSSNYPTPFLLLTLTYIRSCCSRQLFQVEPDFLIGFLDSCIESLKLSKEDDINGIITRSELIEKLQERKRNVELTLKKRIQDNAKKSSSTKTSQESINTPTNTASTVDPFQPITKSTKKSLSTSSVSQVQPPQSQPIQESSSMQVLAAKLDDISMSSEVSGSDPTHTTTSGDTSSEITTISRHDQSQKASASKNRNGLPSETHGSHMHTEVTRNGQVTKETAEFAVSSETVYQIVDAVRQNTNLSHELSCVAFRTILSEMEMIMPRKALPYLNGIAVHLSSPLLAPDNLLGETHDARRLRAIFADLADCKNDSEQRTWMLYEDEDDIIQYIQELTGILVRPYDELLNVVSLLSNHMIFCFTEKCRSSYLLPRDELRPLPEYHQFSAILPDGDALVHSEAPVAVLQSHVRTGSSLR